MQPNSMQDKLPFLSDNETKVDLLNNEAIANTIIKLLIDHMGQPITIGVHGDWGSGKSSILEMIESNLENKKGILCLKFNGWRFQGFEDAKIALIEGIISSLLDKRPGIKKSSEKILSVVKRIEWLKVAKFAGSIAFSASTGIPNFSLFQGLIPLLTAIYQDPTKQEQRDEIIKIINDTNSLIKPESSSKKITEEIEEFRTEFDELLEEAKISRLIVLIDDLDRCLPDTAIETLEAIRLFVSTPRTAFVVAADETMIEYAVRKHFPDLPNSTGPQTYARNYLEKLIQVPFRVPSLGIAETRIYITLLLIASLLKEDNEDFIRLICASRKLLMKPWSGKVIDTDLLTNCLGEIAKEMNQVLILSDQIGPILAKGSNGNPRQIKRFLNTILLRKNTADVRGFGNEIILPILAKLTLAERFQTPFFEQIASIVVKSSDGRCDELGLLEKTILEEDFQTKVVSLKNTKKNTLNDKENPIIKDWIENNWIIEWARISPSMSDVDIRPYLFISKDKKDYFGTITSLGYLSTVAEILLGPRLTVQSKENDLKNLSASEANEVFEILRNRIISNSSLVNIPDGVAGMTILAKVHPTLQIKVLNFLDGLPTEQLGLWVVSGWTEVFKDPEHIEGFKNLLKKWANEQKNPSLKVAASSVLKTEKDR